ncbi:Ankyrin repeat-containing domain protein [Rhypophila decipiens]
MYAVREGKDRLVKVLLERGARPDDKDEKDSTPLVDAIRGGQEKSVRILLENGARPNLKDGYGVTPLQHAAWKGDYAILECLLDHGADTEAADYEGNTPLIAAVQGGHEALVQRLVDHGADTEARHNDGNTALSYATKRNHESILQILKEGPSSRPAKTTTASRATFGCPLARFTHPPFKDRSDLDKHIEAEHGDIYIRIFEFAGCRSKLSNKDVRKKHVASEHLLHDYYVCNELHPRKDDQSVVFRGKDLYTRHVISAHMGAILPDTPEWARRLQGLLLSASKEKLPPVRELGCPGEKCGHWYRSGNQLWDQHMDHIARHLEASEPVHFGGLEDKSFVKWASDPNVGIIRHFGSTNYRLDPVLGLDSESE